MTKSVDMSLLVKWLEKSKTGAPSTEQCILESLFSDPNLECTPEKSKTIQAANTEVLEVVESPGKRKRWDYSHYDLCIGYMNINCAFYDLSFSSVFISKFCVILSKHFRGNLNSPFFLSRENRENKSLAKKIILQYFSRFLHYRLFCATQFFLRATKKMHSNFLQLNIAR